MTTKSPDVRNTKKTMPKGNFPLPPNRVDRETEVVSFDLHDGHKLDVFKNADASNGKGWEKNIAITDFLINPVKNALTKKIQANITANKSKTI